VGGDHPQQELADFGYIPKERKVKDFMNTILSLSLDSAANC
jgi:hypothetical protein